MFIIEKPEAFDILTFSNNFLDYDEKNNYVKTLRNYGYIQEAFELETKISEGDFYELLELYLNSYHHKNIH